MTELNTDLVKKIQTQSLSSVILSQLEELILSGTILPGERINESKLANSLGVSRAPIREACRQLERSGMVEVLANRGTFVKEIDIVEIEELYDIRATLDAMAVEKVCQRISEKQISKLSGFVKTMEKACQEGDEQCYFHANLDFHSYIISLAANKNLVDIYDGVSKKSSLFRRTSLSIPGRLSVSLQQHVSILKAIIAGESKKASDLMKEHIMDAKKALLASCAASEEN